MEKISDTGKGISDLPFLDQKEYYEKIRKQCLLLKDKQFHFGQDLIKRLYPIIRNYKIEIQGEEYIPSDSNVLFVANHSNSHDIFTAYEMFSILQRRGSVMVATDCLNPITTEIFNISNATLLDRRDKIERHESVLKLSRKILKGNDGLIFAEGTWNIHPTMLMHNVQNGAAKVSLITQVPVVPVIFEYIENETMVSTESELFNKCIIRFGKPIMIDYFDVLSSQSNRIKEEMSNIRRELWKNYDIDRDCISNINPLMYINHTYAKKFEAFGFTYNSRIEQEYLLFLKNERRENEYTLNEQGILVPGVTEKKSELRKLLKK